MLQERAFERVGSGEQRRANVRILAATHRDLETRARAGEFREDLFFRLNVFPIVVPPLRERFDDLPALIDDLVRRGEAEGRPSIAFTRDGARVSRGVLVARQRARAAESHRAACHPVSEPDRSTASTCRRRSASGAAAPQPAVTTIPTTGLDLREYLGNIEKQLIRSALDQTDGTVAHAARLLKLQRTTLVEKLRKYELHAQA